jgi:hypothetical protein
LLIEARDIGAFDLWADQFPTDYVPLIYRLILDTWPDVKKDTASHEVPITRDLCSRLRRSKDRSRSPFSIHLESHELDDEGEETGRIDLKFMHGHREHVYYSIECKRLRVVQKDGSISALVAEYVKEGMFRYFNGQYAVGLDKGGMLGYVMDGDVPKAKSNVAASIKGNKKKLRMKPQGSVKVSSILPTHPGMFDTRHTQPTTGPFVIHHLLLAMC